MPSRLVAVTYDAQDPLGLARFWAEALEREVVECDGGALAVGSTSQLGLLFVPSDPGRTAPHRMHLHVTSEGREQQVVVDRLLALGATPLDVGQLPEEGHVVLADPEGNALCVIEPTNTFLRGCGPLGELACDGGRAVGQFWSRAVGWPLVWDEGDETAIQSPEGGTKVAWGGESLEPPAGRSRQRLHLVTDHALEDEVARLVSLGASRVDAVVGHATMADPDGNDFDVHAVPGPLRTSSA